MTLSQFIEKFERERGYSPRVAFIGLGTSNSSLLKGSGLGQATIRSMAEIDRNSLHGGGSPRIIEGEGYLSDINEDILVLSPSVRRDKPEIADAMKRGAIVTSDAELFFLERGKGDYLVTGSDGKSTTATLAAMLLGETIPDVETIGNIGKPFAEFDGETAVGELSSFQLSYVEPKSHAAVITTITPNHLNWHSSLSEYVEAKVNITKFTDRLVLSPDTPIEEEIIPIYRPSAVYSLKYTLSELMRAYPFAGDIITAEGGEIRHNGKRLVGIEDVTRSEGHNLHNLMGAIALTLGEFSNEHLREVARGFRGLRHRMEHFLTRGGVDFINSSIDTTPARTSATLMALSRPIRIILGGGAKGLSISELAPILSEYATRVAFYGEAGALYWSEISSIGDSARYEAGVFDKFDDALEYILEDLHTGETVLLSPAATGYGEFRNFAERGEYFKDYIKKL